MSDHDDVYLACEVAVLKAIAVAGTKIKNHRARTVRGPEYQYRDVPHSRLYLAVRPTISDHEVTGHRLLQRAWEPLRESLAAHGLEDRHIACIETACEEYVRNRLTTPAPHERGVLALYLAEAHAAASS